MSLFGVPLTLGTRRNGETVEVGSGLFAWLTVSQEQQSGSGMSSDAPEPSPEARPLVERARKLLEEFNYAETLQVAEQLLVVATERNDLVGQAYAYAFRGRALQATNRLEQAQQAWEQLEQLAHTLGESSWQIEAWLGQAFCKQRTNPAETQTLFERALSAARAENRRPQYVADALVSQGNDWYTVGELDRAQQLFELARAIYERVAPESLGLADALNNLGLVADARGTLDLAQQYYERALSIRQRYAPDSLIVADTLNNLAGIAYRKGDLERATEQLGQALAIYERLSPNSLRVARALSNLGLLETDKGDLEAAEKHLERALTLTQRLLPESPLLATVLNGLLTVAYFQGDWEQARRYGERALAVLLRIAPRSANTAAVLNNLGVIATNQRMFAVAESYYRRALEIYEQINPLSMDVASTLVNLGVVASEQEGWESARRYYERALQIREQTAPQSLSVATVWNNLGVLAANQADLARAEQSFQRALSIRKRYAPQSPETAETLSNLAQLAIRRRQFQRALEYLTEAVQIVETQRGFVGSSEGRARFAERYFGVYSLLALAYLQQGQVAKAAEALERSRARTLAETMHQRRLLQATLPPALRTLLAQLQQLDVQQQRTYAQLSQLSSEDTEGITACQEALRRINQQQRALSERMRREFPRYAELLSPQPLTLQQIQQSLEAGTVLLYYALVEDHLLIVAITRTEARGYAISIPTKQLEQDVQQFTRCVSKPSYLRSALEREQLVPLARRLYAQLVQPTQEMLKRASRVLLCPSGVLNLLPWAALVAGTRNNAPIYWIEQVPLRFTPSMSVYRQVRSVALPASSVVIAAVSDYESQVLVNTPTARSEALRGMEAPPTPTVLPNLPEVQREAAQLRALFGKRARVLLNAGATPARVQALARTAQVVHFACHALADNTNPIASALMLAPVGSEEGTLTAAEVLEWQLRADLVMLSACETGIGFSRQYEGIYSLARAFMYAGAQSVGASLWAVSDASTAVLMREFYRRYLQGVPKDQALRAAQQALLRGRWQGVKPHERAQFADPYFWAGFVMIGK
ncbi:MAG: CHAT domain-containing protein [Armatimonadota bacterium]|nr:CHAT domain-containing protein [Armatimonadota bacterium]